MSEAETKSELDLVQINSNFTTLEKCLSSEIDQKSFSFISAFVDYFSDVNKYQQSKSSFESSSVLAKLLERIQTTKPPALVTVLKLLMIFCRSENNHAFLAKMEGIPVLLNTMRRHTIDLHVQEQGCRCLINIGTSDKNRKVISKEGGIEVILDSLRNGGSYTPLLIASCWALRNIAVNDANKKQICQKGGLELIARTMSSHPTDINLQTQACWAIENISIRDDVRDQIGSSGIIIHVLNAMRTFPTDKKLQEASCWALSNLSTNSKCSEIMRKESTVELLMEAARNFSDVEAIQNHVSACISTLGEDSDSEDESKNTSNEPRPASLAVIRKGYLTKQGGRIKTWKKRWFVLDSSKLTYFKSHEDMIPLGTIDLHSCEGVMEDALNKKNCFLIVTQKRIFKIIALSRQEMAEWMISIKKVQETISQDSRPRSIEGSAFMKMEERDKLKFLEENSTQEPLKEKKEEVRSSASIQGPVKSPSVDFFSIPEKVPPHELDPFILDKVIRSISKNVCYSKIMLFENPEILIAKVAREITNEIHKSHLDDAYIINLRGEKTTNVDATKINKAISIISESICESILSDKNLLEQLKKTSKRPQSQVWAEQGIRKTMEDEHIISQYLNILVGDNSMKHEYSFYGIFDGHGGSRAAEYIACHLYWNVIKDILDPPIEVLAHFNLTDKNDEKANKEELLLESIKSAFIRTNENFFEHLNRNAIVDACGSTAVVTVQQDKDLYTCWVGDSEAALYKKDGQSIVLCRPHKANSESEKKRIEELGGFIQEVNGVQRMNGILAVTRSFGDARFRRFVTAEPEITKYTLDGSEDFMVLACDGLWDVMKAPDVYSFISEYRKQKKSVEGATEALIKRALDLKSGDNISVILIFF